MNTNNSLDKQPPMGRIENGIAANYDFSICDVFSEAWEKVPGFKGPIWLGFLICLGVAIGIYIALGLVGSLISIVSTILSVLVCSIAEIFLYFVPYVMAAGIAMMGIKRSVNLPVRGEMVLDYFSSYWRIVGAVSLKWIVAPLPILVGLMLTVFLYHLLFVSAVVLLLSIAGSLYLFLGYYFVLPLTVEKKLELWQTLEVSRKGVTQHWFKICFTLILLHLIIVISAIPLGIGLIWTLPLAQSVNGVLYRTLFGVEQASS
jgi:hypothetical protein